MVIGRSVDRSIGRSEFRAVLFDLDGTLIDSSEDLAASVNHARATLSMPPLPLAKVREYIGDGVQVLLTRALGDAALVPRGLEAFRAYYEDHLLDRTVAYAGIAGMLDALAARGVPLAVVTNKVEGFSRVILERLGLLSRFAAVIGSDSGHGKKPDPAPFHAALAAAAPGVAPAEALVVGDSRNDVIGARACGMRVCVVGYGIGDPRELRGLAPDYCVDSPEELVGVVLGGSGSPMSTSPPSMRTS